VFAGNFTKAAMSAIRVEGTASASQERRRGSRQLDTRDTRTSISCRTHERPARRQAPGCGCGSFCLSVCGRV